MDLGEVDERMARMRIREPDAVTQPEPGMAVERDAEGPRQELLAHERAQRRALGFERLPAVPG